MKKTVVIFAHNDLEKSLSNNIIVENLADQENIEVRNLISLYPDYKIDIQAEQEAIVEADTIVLQFPFFWYSAPAILKAWIDDVLQYGFAFGSNGDKLAGKNLVLSFTTGAPEQVYLNQQGENIIPGMLSPFKGTSDMIQTNYIDPVISYNMSYIPGVHDKDEIVAQANTHSQKLLDVLKSL